MNKIEIKNKKSLTLNAIRPIVYRITNADILSAKNLAHHEAYIGFVYQGESQGFILVFAIEGDTQFIKTPA